MGNIPFTTLTMPSCLRGSSSEKGYSLPFLICYFKYTLANLCILFYPCYSWSVQNFQRIKHFVRHKLQVLTKRPFLSAGISPLKNWAHSEGASPKFLWREAEFKLFTPRNESQSMQETSQRRRPNIGSAAWADFYKRPWKCTHGVKTWKWNPCSVPSFCCFLSICKIYLKYK